MRVIQCTLHRQLVIRYGILGFGHHAVRRLMPGFALARNSSVTALSRRDMAKARASASEYGIPLAFNSAADLCRSPEVDAVFVTTPNSCHLRDVLLAIECGKPVLCEKPMGMNAGECRQMVEAARRANVLLGVAQVFRFENSVASFRDRIAAGRIGRAIYARSEFCYPARSHPRKWLFDPALAGGGPIADVGVHCIDALRCILNDEVVRVAASGILSERNEEIEAAAVLSLEFSRGTLGSVFVSTLSGYRTPLEIVGESGSLRGDDALSVDRPINLEWRQNGKVVDTESVSNGDAYARQIDDFSAVVETGRPFAAPGEQGWQNQEILDAAYRSLKSGKAEIVPRVVR
jgi:predicted dehydrogenase